MKRVKTILKGIPSVRNFTSNSGNEVANQFKIYFNNGVLFQSYTSIIAIKLDDGRVFLDGKTWNYSKTTGKYRNYFLGEGIAETREKIKNGSYILTDLN